MQEINRVGIPTQLCATYHIKCGPVIRPLLRVSYRLSGHALEECEAADLLEMWT